MRLKLTHLGLLLCLGGVSTAEEVRTMKGPQFTLATYRVELDKQVEFIGLLKGCESTMREEGLITTSPILRMRSNADPTLILEIFQWVDSGAFERAQENRAVLDWWGKYEKTWMEGGFGMNTFPEASQPWAQFQTIH